MVVQLPIELLQLIFHDAKPETLRTCRLVDRQWNAASTPYLFERFNVSLFSRSLSKLERLSQSPLAKHVKFIEYHSDQLPDYYTRAQWESKIDLRQRFSTYRATFAESADLSRVSNAYNELSKHEYTAAQLEAGWLAFQACLAEQQRWVDGQSGLVLKTCISRLRNVREVLIAPAKPFGGRLNDTPFWGNMMGEILIGPDAWTYDDKGTDDEFEALSALLIMTAIGHRSTLPGVKAVEKLTLDMPLRIPFHDIIYLPPQRFDTIPPEYPLCKFTGADLNLVDPDARYKVIVNAFRPLKHLQINFPSVSFEDHLHHQRAHEQAKETELFLRVAVNLQILRMDFGEPDHYYEGATEEEDQTEFGLLNFLSSVGKTYPYLEELNVSASFGSTSFSRFLVSHSNTLKRVAIIDSLCDDWNIVLHTIATKLKLDYVHVESLWQLETGDAVAADGPGLLFAEGLDADDDFTKAMKCFLYTGEGSMPRLEDYKPSSDDEEDPSEEDSEYHYYDDDGEIWFM